MLTEVTLKNCDYNFYSILSQKKIPKILGATSHLKISKRRADSSDLQEIEVIAIFIHSLTLQLLRSAVTTLGAACVFHRPVTNVRVYRHRLNLSILIVVSRSRRPRIWLNSLTARSRDTYPGSRAITGHVGPKRARGETRQPRFRLGGSPLIFDRSRRGIFVFGTSLRPTSRLHGVWLAFTRTIM